MPCLRLKGKAVLFVITKDFAKLGAERCHARAGRHALRYRDGYRPDIDYARAGLSQHRQRERDGRASTGGGARANRRRAGYGKSSSRGRATAGQHSRRQHHGQEDACHGSRSHEATLGPA